MPSLLGLARESAAAEVQLQPSALLLGGHYGPGALGGGCGAVVAPATSMNTVLGDRSGTMSQTSVAAVRPSASLTVTVMLGEA